MTAPPSLCLSRVCFAYDPGHPLLTELDLTVAPGEVVAVMGPSGTGKSSLLGLVSGLLEASSGEVRVLGHDFTAMKPADRGDVRRRRLGMVFQAPELLPELSVLENVALTLIFDGARRAQAFDLARRALASVGLTELDDRSVDEVSGGEAQRIALARALVRPELGLIVADEPTASLDQANAQHVVGLLVDNARRQRAGALVATHDPAVAARCDRVVDLLGDHA